MLEGSTFGFLLSHSPLGLLLRVSLLDLRVPPSWEVPFVGALAWVSLGILVVHPLVPKVAVYDPLHSVAPLREDCFVA